MDGVLVQDPSTLVAHWSAFDIEEIDIGLLTYDRFWSKVSIGAE